MKKIFVLLFLAFSIISKAQENTDVHRIAGERLTQGINYLQDSFSWFDKEWGIGSEIFIKEDSVLLRLMSIRIPLAYDIEKGSQILVKLENGGVIEGKCFNDAKYIPREYSSIISQFVTPQYVFAKEDINKITESGITKIRLSVGTHFIDKDIPAKSKNYVKDGWLFLEDYAKSKPSIYDGF